MGKSEYLLDKKNNFVTRYGTTLEEDCPSVIYLRTKSKITPLVKKKEYETEIENVKKSFSSFVKNTITSNNNVDDNYLFNLDITSNGVKYGKVSYLRYDVYLKPLKLKTLEKNKFRMQCLSKKLDRELERLLNKNGIHCQ